MACELARGVCPGGIVGNGSTVVQFGRFGRSIQPMYRSRRLKYPPKRPHHQSGRLLGQCWAHHAVLKIGYRVGYRKTAPEPFERYEGIDVEARAARQAHHTPSPIRPLHLLTLATIQSHRARPCCSGLLRSSRSSFSSSRKCLRSRARAIFAMCMYVCAYLIMCRSRRRPFGRLIRMPCPSATTNRHVVAFVPASARLGRLQSSIQTRCMCMIGSWAPAHLTRRGGGLSREFPFKYRVHTGAAPRR